MKSIAWLIIIIMVMSSTAMDAFSHICDMKIKSGVMYLVGTGALIEAVGNKNGISWEITCAWKGGIPAWIYYSNPRIDDVWM
jgi:hypothetical protein